MRAIILFSAACWIGIGTILSGCQTDKEVARVNAAVQKYCTQLRPAADIAAALANKPLVDKINAGLQTYCDSPVTNVPDALAKLAAIYKAVTNAGIPLTSL